MRPLIGYPTALLVAAYIIAGHFWTALFIALVVACLGLGLALSDARQRIAELSDADDRCEALEAALVDALRDAETAPVPLVPVEVVEKPDLRIVQPDDQGPEWPRLAEQIEREATPVHDDLAVETFMEQVDAWGNEVERDV